MFGTSRTNEPVMAGLGTASRVHPTCAALNSSELGQARVPVPSTSLLQKSKTWMPGTRPGMTIERPAPMAVSTTSARVEAPGQNAFLRVQAGLGLVEHHRLRPVDHR